MPKKKTQYTTVHLPIDLLQIVDSLIDEGKYGYSSRAEFVKDAIRRYLEWHGYYPLRKSKSNIEDLLMETAKKLIKNKEAKF